MVSGKMWWTPSRLFKGFSFHPDQVFDFNNNFALIVSV